MNFLFACGGTAGHINPALAIAAELRRSVPDAGFLFIGAGREMENRLIPDAGYELENIKMSGLKRGYSPGDLLSNFKTVREVAKANARAAEIIRDFGPSAAVGTGGYICYPVLRTAAKMGVPSFIHESNAVPGLTTKLLGAIVDRVFVSFPGIEDKYRKPERVVFTGTPVRDGFARPGGGCGRAENEKPTVASFWGSLGAEHMNEIMAEFIRLNIAAGEFDHIHATGNNAAEVMKQRLARLGVADELPPGVEIREYIDDMPAVMRSADLILCRAGGSTVAELTALGKPAVLVPSPYVTNDQQTHNALQVHKAGGAVMLPEKDCSGEKLFDLVSTILRNTAELKKMADAQTALGVPDAASRISEIILARCTGTDAAGE